ncbi:hypothetical protein [Streptomyces sp. NPDC003480]
MSAHIVRWRCLPVAPSDQTEAMAPIHRITLYTVILVVVILLVRGGRSSSDAIGLVMATGAAASQIGAWLSGQRPADSSGGA